MVRFSSKTIGQKLPTCLELTPTTTRMQGTRHFPALIRRPNLLIQDLPDFSCQIFNGERLLNEIFPFC